MRTISDHIYLLGSVARTEKLYIPVMFAYVIFQFAAPFVLIIPPKYIVDGLAEGKTIIEVFPLIVAMGGLYLIVNLLLKGIFTVKSNLELRLKVRLNVMMCDKCMRLDYADFESNDTIHIINSARLAVNGGLTYAQSIGLSGSQGIGGYFTQLGDLAANIMKIIGMLYILKELKVWVIMVMVVGMIVNVFCCYEKKRINIVLRNYAAPFLRKNQYCNRLLRSVEAGKDIRLYDLEDYLLDKFSECNENYIKAKNQYRNHLVMADIVSAACGGCVTFAVFFSLIFLLNTGNITVGGFVMVSSAVVGLFGCGVQVVSELMDLDIHLTYMKDYRKLMECTTATGSTGRKVCSGIHVIRFENVSFSYANSDKKVLDHVSITIHGGESISIVGMNGAGKSTFVKLLTGLYRPTEGQIYIDDIPIGEIDRDSLIDHMAVLFQDFNIYSMTVEENVTFTGREDLNGIEKSLAESGMLERIKGMKDGIGTFVRDIFGNRGESLSGGEEQKLALARVLYRKSDLLILDEPTAALDARAEYEIYASILKHLHNRTVLFVSHRMASSKFCDRILVFQNGRIVETGTHPELVALNGLYKKMWDSQVKYYHEPSEDSCHCGREPV